MFVPTVLGPMIAIIAGIVGYGVYQAIQGASGVVLALVVGLVILSGGFFLMDRLLRR